MKNIELTEDHKSKLLEMCKELFSEYNYYSLHKTDNILTFRSNYFYNHDDDWSYDEQLHIHWFEFCVTKLSLKILCQNKSIINSSYSKNYFLQNKIINSDEHIINYLYKEFKKLK